MTNTLATLVRTAPAPPGGLSPKVRRLLRDHDLDMAMVRGTGHRGRITPTDVERTARGYDSTRPPGGAHDTPRLASPLARRMLRDAGLALEDVAASGPITRRVVEAALDDRTAVAHQPDTATATREVDLTRVVYAVGAAREVAGRRTGVELTTFGPIAHAVCRSLRRHPAVHAPEDQPHQRDVDLAVVVATPAGLAARVVPCAQDLTVPALDARRAGLSHDGSDETRDPSFAMAGDGWGATPSVPDGLLPERTTMLVVDPARQQTVTTPDEFGGDTTSTRWRTTLRLTHDARRVDAVAVERFLDDLARELETVDLLAAVA